MDIWPRRLHQMQNRALRGTFVLLLSVTLAFVPVHTRPALACAFDMVKPERTLIDWIVDSDSLVLARPAADNPFKFAVVDVLSGSAVPGPVTHLVDSSTRRKLALHADDAVLFAEIANGEWRRVAYIDDAFRDVLHTALAHRNTWREAMPQSRIDFLDALQDTPDPRYRAIVIGELDKVSYAQLQTFDLRIPLEDLIAQLWTKEGYPYQAIHALLIGLSGTEDARAVISKAIRGAKGGAMPANLGAFAAAYIELDGPAAISALAADILQDPAQSLEKLEQIIMALSVHQALVDDVQQAAINAAIARLVRDRPAAAEAVARQFTRRGNWSQSALLNELVRDRKLVSMDAYYTVALYLSEARNQQSAQNGG